VAGTCGKHVKKGCFELGGNDPFIVLDDADVELAVNKGFASRLATNGQACINAKRFIIADEVYDEFKERLIEKIKKEIIIGDPMDPSVNLGPLSMKRQYLKLKEQVSNAVNKDCGTIAHGSVDFQLKDPELKNGNFFEPMVIENIDTDSPSFSEEFFGPVFNLFKSSSLKESLDLANKSDYGLSGAVFSQDPEKLEYAALRLRTGTVFLNEMSASYSDVPSGGIKASGIGRECYHDGLLEMANRKPILRAKH